MNPNADDGLYGPFETTPEDHEEYGIHSVYLSNIVLDKEYPLCYTPLCQVRRKGSRLYKDL